MLQEYFIPVRHFVALAREMAALIGRHHAQVPNVSVRHSPAGTLSLLPWARQKVLSFVIYFKQRIHAAAQRRVAQWTREMIDAALQYDARYYLPYQLHATPSQFARASPEAAQLRALKQAVHPAHQFSTALWAKYSG